MDGFQIGVIDGWKRCSGHHSTDDIQPEIRRKKRRVITDILFFSVIVQDGEVL